MVDIIRSEVDIVEVPHLACVYSTCITEEEYPTDQDTPDTKRKNYELLRRVAEECDMTNPIQKERFDSIKMQVLSKLKETVEVRGRRQSLGRSSRLGSTGCVRSQRNKRSSEETLQAGSVTRQRKDSQASQ